MNLRLSRSLSTQPRTVLIAEPTDSDASDTPPTPLYHIYSPGKWSRKTTIVSKIDPSIAHDPEHKFESGKSSNVKENSAYLGGGVEEYARIHWHSTSSTRVIMEGRILETDTFLPACGFLKAHRKFQGPDGLWYTWHNNLHQTLSVTKDGEELEVARYHEPWSFKKKPYISIKPEAMHMVDLVVVTWLYVATRQLDMATAAAASA